MKRKAAKPRTKKQAICLAYKLENKIAADNFARTAKALGNLPPTPAEILQVQLNGLPQGFHAPRKGEQDIFTKTRRRKSVSWNTQRSKTGPNT